MSSKLHRGGIPTDAVPWRRVSAADVVPSGGPTFPIADSAGGGAIPGPGGNAQAAYQQGFQEGKAAGRAELAPQIDAMHARLARTIEELTGMRARLRQEAEGDVVALALAIAKRILHRELTVDPDALLGLVKAGFEKIELSEVHRVRVSRQDAPVVQQHLEKMGLPHRVEVVGDPTLERGSALLVSSHGTLDASIDTQLAEIERGFADLVRRS